MAVNRYEYEVVTCNGHGVHARGFRRCAVAKARAARLALTAPGLGPYEVQRVLVFPGGGRRYWMRGRGRWVPWDAHADAEIRKPDWIYGPAREANDD